MEHETIKLLYIDAPDQDSLNLKASFEYLRSGTIGSLQYIAYYKGNYYCSWSGELKKLVWSGHPDDYAYWETTRDCPKGLLHYPVAMIEGRFSFTEQQTKLCSCPLDKLMNSGCKCGGE